MYMYLSSMFELSETRGEIQTKWVRLNAQSNAMNLKRLALSDGMSKLVKSRRSLMFERTLF